ncbi:MAG: hypothetical protein EPO68_00135, partial [Planctomycetota bacterium]
MERATPSAAVRVASPSRRVADVALIALFAAAICAPLVDQFARPAAKRSVQVELRQPAPPPRLRFERAALLAFPKSFDLWCGDSFGLRDKLLRSRNALLWFGLRVSPTPQMMLGEGGWVFPTHNRSIDNFRGACPFDAAQLDAWRRELERRRDSFAKLGSRYVYAIVPDKLSVYPEHVPARYNRVGPSRRAQLVEHLSAHSDLRVLDLLPVLEAARRADGAADSIYFPLGAHWTGRGALAGGMAIVARLHELFPVIQPWSESDFAFEPDPEPGDSWAGRLYMDGLLEQRVRRVVPLRERRARRVEGERLPNRGVTWVNQDASLPRAVLLHDSFGPPLIPLLAEHLSFVRAYWAPEVDARVVEELRPDVVIEMFVERALVAQTPDVEARAAA